MQSNGGRLAAALIIVFVLSACTQQRSRGDIVEARHTSAAAQSSSEQDQPATNTGVPTTTPMTSSEQTNTSKAIPKQMVSPFDAYFFSATITVDELQKRTAQDELRRSMIDKCMIEGGFSWYREEPMVTATNAPSQNYGEDLSAVRERGYKAYALETWIEKTGRWVETAKATDGYTDAEFDELSEWYGKCYSEASAQVAATQPSRSAEAIEMISNMAHEFQQAQKRIRENPGFGDIWAEWASCMATKGYEVQQRSDAANLMRERFDQIHTRLLQHERGTPLPKELVEEIDRFAVDEKVIVDADLGCADSIDLDNRILTLRRELEKQEVATNGDRWELLRLELCAHLPPGEGPC